MRIRWLNDTTGLKLNPTWDIKSALIHTIDRVVDEIGKRVPTTLLVLRFNMDERMLRNFMKQYAIDKKYMMFGTFIAELKTGQPIWVSPSPPGYELVIPTSTFHAFEIIEDEHGMEKSEGGA